MLHWSFIIAYYACTMFIKNYNVKLRLDNKNKEFIYLLGVRIDMSWNKIYSKYGNRCSSCQERNYKGSEIFWNNDGSHRVTHYRCGLKHQNISEESVDSNVVDLGAIPQSTELGYKIEIVSDLEEQQPPESETQDANGEEEHQTEADRIRAKILALPSKKENVWFEKRKEERKFRMENYSP